MKAQQFNGSYPMKEGTGISVSLAVILYEEDKIYYAYCAALDILGYGNSEEEARRSFEIMLEEILKYAISEELLVRCSNLMDGKSDSLQRRAILSPEAASWQILSITKHTGLFGRI